MFEICTYGAPVLRKRALPVETFDDDLRKFAVELAETMYARDGVGLAATQVGRSIRVVVIDVSREGKSPVLLVNPQVTWSSEEVEESEEGCLSVPEIRLPVKRPLRVSVKARNLDGTELVIENADGLMARALQHEIDHLDGILFVDRASPIQRQLVATKLKKLAKESRGSPCTA
jgi:peptide deformylase